MRRFLKPLQLLHENVVFGLFVQVICTIIYLVYKREDTYLKVILNIGVNIYLDCLYNVSTHGTKGNDQ